MHLWSLPRVLASIAIAGLSSIGCGSETDDRPATKEYIVAAILAPSCGNAACHSSAAAVAGYAFDTLSAATKALDELVVPGSDRSELLRVLRESGGDRMPLDSPLPDADIELIEKWILEGAK
jgi:hypothetical protein